MTRRGSKVGGVSDIGENSTQPIIAGFARIAGVRPGRATATIRDNAATQEPRHRTARNAPGSRRSTVRASAQTPQQNETIMAKILATEIRVGNLLEFDKRVWRVLKSYHVHVGGRGGAYMQIEIKDVESGQKRNERLSTDEKIERPFIDRRTMTYSYHDGANWVFMDNETYEQLTLGDDALEGQTGYLMPNMEVEINFHDGRVIGIQLPTTVVLEVVDTEPGIKNATATTSFKPAKLETGISVQVPPFVNNGEKIRVNTDDGSYVERA
jgi:elongation factor P